MTARVHRCAPVLMTMLAAVVAAVAVHPAGSVAATSSGCGDVRAGVHRDAPGAGKTVALTFDDGPGADTDKILSILSAAHVEATFFNVGYAEAGAPKLVGKAHAAGFALGDHTWDHADLSGLSAAGQAREIDRERTEQASITGIFSCLLRPPYGTYNATTLQLAQERGMRVWLWSVDTEDWKAAGSSDAFWVKRIISRAKAGGTQRHPVLIMHNQPGGNPATVQALPAIIRFYRSHGYSFVDLYGHTGHPVVRRLSTHSGRLAGGTRVTVHGHGFLGVQAVRFGSARGTHVQVVSSTELLVTSPPHTAGSVQVRVQTTFGTSPVASDARFRYVAPPTVTSIAPVTGPTAGGTVVRVTGTAFRDVRAVWFGGVQGSDVRVVSHRRLYVTTPRHRAGSYPIRVITAYGRSSPVPSVDFAFVHG
jgi:peptidoglycan/xylan/chitin deacetylase (PgdA/CDA1 family)